MYYKVKWLILVLQGFKIIVDLKEKQIVILIKHFFGFKAEVVSNHYGKIGLVFVVCFKNVFSLKSKEEKERSGP